jgi:transcriptional regulator with XRE-family HTH domain
MINYKIKAAREAKRYSQEYLAAVLGITQATYSRIETGTIKLDLQKLTKLCDLFELKLEDLIK